MSIQLKCKLGDKDNLLVQYVDDQGRFIVRVSEDGKTSDIILTNKQAQELLEYLMARVEGF